MTSEIGKKAIVNGYVGTGKVVRTIGRTVEVEFAYGKVTADRDKVVIFE